MAKATKTIKQSLSYKSAHTSYFAATKRLFNQVAAFYFEVITLHEKVLELSSKEALTCVPFWKPLCFSQGRKAARKLKNPH